MVGAFYFTDADSGVYRVEGGAITAAWAGLAGYLTNDGTGNIVATGVPESGGTKAMGVRLHGTDLSMLNAMWGASDATGVWHEGTKPVSEASTRNFQGAGALYNESSGEVLISTIFRRYTDDTWTVQESESQVAHFAADGTFRKVRSESGGAQQIFLGHASLQERGVAMLGGKFYFLYNAQSIAEYDPVTGVTRGAYQGLTNTFDFLDLAADPATGKLWALNEFSDAGKYYARSFYPADVAWGTNGSPLTSFRDMVVAADDIDSSFGFYGAPMAFAVVGDGTLLVAGWEWNSGDLAFYTVPMTGGSPTPVFQDSAHFDCWDILLPGTVMPDLTAVRRPHRTSFDL